MRRTLCVMVLAALAVATPAVAFDWEALSFDAAGAAYPFDGGDTMEVLSWRLCEADFDTEILDDRKLWLDVLEPTRNVGAGVSVDIAPEGPAALGVGYHERHWLGYITGHWEVRW